MSPHPRLRMAFMIILAIGAIFAGLKIEELDNLVPSSVEVVEREWVEHKDYRNRFRFALPEDWLVVAGCGSGDTRDIRIGRNDYETGECGKSEDGFSGRRDPIVNIHGPYLKRRGNTRNLPCWLYLKSPKESPVIKNVVCGEYSNSSNYIIQYHEKVASGKPFPITPTFDGPIQLERTQQKQRETIAEGSQSITYYIEGKSSKGRTYKYQISFNGFAYSAAEPDELSRIVESFEIL